MLKFKCYVVKGCAKGECSVVLESMRELLVWELLVQTMIGGIYGGVPGFVFFTFESSDYSS